MELIITIICEKRETEEVKKIIEEKKLKIVTSDETKPDLNFYTFKPSTRIGTGLLMAFEG